MSATPAQVAAATMAFDDALASLGLTPADVPTLQQRYAGMRAALDTLAAPAARTQGAEVAMSSISTNHDAMIILTQDFTSEQKIKAVDAHMRRELSGLAAGAPAEMPKPLSDQDLESIMVDLNMALSEDEAEQMTRFARAVLAAQPSPAESEAPK